MTKGLSEADIVVLYDELIEDILAGIEAQPLDPRDAMDLSVIVAAVNAARKPEGRELVALPPALHSQINEYAKQGMPKGRGRPRSNYLKTLFLESMDDMATERKEALIRSGLVRNKLEASLQAAEEIAVEVRAHGLKRSDETVLKSMSKRR